mmetsp:Transcript_14799/g.29036  ORF Transcript_14799/g.29036 Transcript_14799/m.29036 type:complete len:308 (+) Transcript_14799:15-938(+)
MDESHIPDEEAPLGHEEDHSSAPPLPDRDSKSNEYGGYVDKHDESGHKEILAFIVFIASLVELISAGKVCHDEGKCNNEFAWAVTVGVLSLVLSSMHLVMARFMKDLLEKLEFYIAACLGTLWTVGVLILTFDSPFENTGNGYFSCWLAFTSSQLLVYYTSPTIRDSMNNHLNEMSRSSSVLFLLFVSSCMNLVATSISCHRTACNSGIGFGVSVGVLSIVVCLLHFFVPSISDYTMYTSGTLTILWVSAAGVLTFGTAFTTPGNGYFSTWICMLSSCAWCYISMLESGVEGLPGSKEHEPIKGTDI